jgi:hypothetical protein
MPPGLVRAFGPEPLSARGKHPDIHGQLGASAIATASIAFRAARCCVRLVVRPQRGKVYRVTEMFYTGNAG